MSPIPYIVIVPLAAGFFIPVFGKKAKQLGGYITIAAMLVLFMLSLLIAHAEIGRAHV